MTPNTLRPIGYDDILNLVPERLAMESDEWLRDMGAQALLLTRVALIVHDDSGYRRNKDVSRRIARTMQIKEKFPHLGQKGGRP